MAAQMAGAATVGAGLQATAVVGRFHPLCSNSVWRREDAGMQLRPLVAAPRRRESAGESRKEIRGGWNDPFEYGSDPDMDFGELMSQGKQSAEDPIPDYDEDSPYGFLDFPAFHMPEIASLGTYIRGDVRKCACIVSGGVYENLLFFPVIQLLKDRYPGVKIDTYSSPRGKQTYELNKNVRRAFEHPVDEEFVAPVDLVEILGKLKNEYYDLILSTKLSGWGHACLLWLSDSRKNVSYVFPDVNGAFADVYLSDHFIAPRLNLAEAGYDMYPEMIEYVGREGRGVPRELVQPLYVNVSRKLQEVVQDKYAEPGTASRGDYLVFHGLQSDSAASMHSKGDPDSLLPLSVWAKIANATRTKVVVVIPHKKETMDAYEHLGEEANLIYITTPGQLAALIYDSIGVVTTNTAALQLAIALKKPIVTMFSSAEKAKLFIPAHATNVSVVASKTGTLDGIDVDVVISAMSAMGDHMLAPAPVPAM